MWLNTATLVHWGDICIEWDIIVLTQLLLYLQGEKVIQSKYFWGIPMDRNVEMFKLNIF